MEVKKRRKYSKEFQQDVLNMLRTGDKSVPELSKELGIAEQVIYRWNKKYNGNNTKEEAKLSDQEKERRELHFCFPFLKCDFQLKFIFHIELVCVFK